jgi:hypothetical protein
MDDDCLSSRSGTVGAVCEVEVMPLARVHIVGGDMNASPMSEEAS